MVLDVGGISEQTGKIEATTLTVTGSSGAIVLDDLTNEVGTLSITNTGRDITYFDSDGIIVASLAGDDVNLVAGPITKTGAITATTLTVTGSNGAVLLDDLNNDVGGL